MEDIAPGLLEQIQKAFETNLAADAEGKSLLDKIYAGKGTYADAEEYADVLGRALSDALRNYLSPDVLTDGILYRDIADRTIRPMLETDYSLAAEAAREVQQQLNAKVGLGIKAHAADLPEGRVDGIINVVCSGPFENTKWILNEPLLTFCRAAVDDTLKTNLEFQSKAGASPRIIRRPAGKCCDTCAQLAGIYKYPEETRGMEPSVFWRHNSCRCVVEYDPNNGLGIRENVHTKQLTTDRDTAKIEARKVIGLSINRVNIRKVSDPVVKQMQERSILPDSLIDTLLHPLKIGEIKTDANGNFSFTVIGKKTTAVIDPQNGTLIDAYPTLKNQAKRLAARK